MSVDGELAVAIALMGSDRGRELLGCDWGTAVFTAEDPALCTRQARQVMALHDGDGETFTVKVCLVHRARLYEETNPCAGGGHG